MNEKRKDTEREREREIRRKRERKRDAWFVCVHFFLEILFRQIDICWTVGGGQNFKQIDLSDINPC